MPVFAESSSLPEVLWANFTPTVAFWYAYALAGIGFYGGYDYWRVFGKALYWLGFPIHAMIFATVRLTATDYRWFLVPAVLLCGLGVAMVIVSSEVTQSKGQGVLMVLVITGIATYYAAKPKSFWTEKGGWF